MSKWLSMLLQDTTLEPAGHRLPTELILLIFMHCLDGQLTVCTSLPQVPEDDEFLYVTNAHRKPDCAEYLIQAFTLARVSKAALSHVTLHVKEDSHWITNARRELLRLGKREGARKKMPRGYSLAAFTTDDGLVDVEKWKMAVDEIGRALGSLGKLHRAIGVQN